MNLFKRENPSEKRSKRKTNRRYSSNLASNILTTKPRGRRLKGDRRKVNTAEQVLPPVMARTTQTASTHERMRQRGTLKRRFDISLGVAGAEARLPALPAVSFGWRFASGLMCLLMIICLVNLWKSPAFKIDTIQVEGEKRLTKGDISTVLGVNGESVFLVSPKEMEENLVKAFPELVSAKVQVELPAAITATIVEREPVLSLIFKDTEYWIDSEGVAFNPRGNPGDLIRIEAQGDMPGIQQVVETETALPLAPRLTLDPKFVAAVQSIGKILPEGSMILYDQDHGLGWYDPNGWQVYFGLSNDEIQMKLVVYNSLVEELMNEGISPAMISVEHVHAPYFRMEQ